MATDNNMYTAYIHNLNELTEASAKTKNTDIFVFADTPEMSYKFYIFNGAVETLSITENKNSGDSKVVSDFFSEAFNISNSGTNIAVLWDHGSSWYETKNSKSILYDNNPDDYISIINGEFKKIFSDIYSQTGKKTDILILDACNMQSFEVAYEVKDYVDYIVASEGNVPYLGFPYNEMAYSIDEEGDAEDIGRKIVDIYYEHYNSESTDVNLSLVKTKYLDADLSAIDYLKRDEYEDSDSSINISIDKTSSVIYNLSDYDEYKGIKLFFPKNPLVLLNLYEDYIKLSVDKKYEIMKHEFSSYNISDTTAPTTVKSCDMEKSGNENYTFKYEKSYDLTNLSHYTLFYGSGYSFSNEPFDSIDEELSGDIVLFEDYSISKPYCIFSRKFYTEKNFEDSTGVLAFSLKGLFTDTRFVVVNNGDTLFVNDRYIPKWKRYYVEITKGNIEIIFNWSDYHATQDYIYLDDLSMWGISNFNMKIDSDSICELRKLSYGENIVFIRSEDIHKNRAVIDTVFVFSVEDSVKSDVYPNPSDGIVNLLSDYCGEYLINVYSVDGHSVYSKIGIKNGKTIVLDMKDIELKNGLYYYVLNIEGRNFKGKFYILK